MPTQFVRGRILFIIIVRRFREHTERERSPGNSPDKSLKEKELKKKEKEGKKEEETKTQKERRKRNKRDTVRQWYRQRVVRQSLQFTPSMIYPAGRTSLPSPIYLHFTLFTHATNTYLSLLLCLLSFLSPSFPNEMCFSSSFFPLISPRAREFSGESSRFLIYDRSDPTYTRLLRRCGERGKKIRIKRTERRIEKQEFPPVVYFESLSTVASLLAWIYDVSNMYIALDDMFLERAC